MTAPSRPTRLLGGTSAVAVLVALAIAGAPAPAQTGPSPARITPAGVGAVKLGATYRALRAARRIGRVRRGCELAGPNARSAPLRAPLRGSVDLTQTSPRRVANIAVRGGAAARGVGIGARSADIRRAFPRARFDRATEETFGITLVTVPRRGGGRLQFAVDADTDRVQLIGIPFIPFCE